ncbi:hypothetical protein Taro_019977 [Colocasia esculenta]|uniref:Uncharacterized protein n=1 Tax=Colocasia esculenta TaxID=4460 RepID=A0A843V738_COLES|nr:hypothetical protein [Colocasia esculenta]
MLYTLVNVPWLREVGVAERHPERTSRDVRSGRSSRPGTSGSCTSPTAAYGLWSIHARSGASHADAGSYSGCTPGTVGDPGLVGDTHLEETVESDSKRGE